MKTQDEIVQRIKHVTPDDFFGTETQALLEALDYEYAKQFLNDIAPTDWLDTISTDEEVFVRMRNYLTFAWSKANDCRGLSAQRSISWMKGYLFLLGQEDLLNSMDVMYEFYGKPNLVACSHLCNFPWQEHDDGRWVNNEKEKGISAEQALLRKGLGKYLLG